MSRKPRRPRKPPWTEAKRLANIRKEVAAELAMGVSKHEDPLFRDRRMLLRLLDEADARYAARWLKEASDERS
jgi:hypothetical protein